jgi:predicted nuclease of restriction endonuclease-like RecB superfamily
MAEPRVPFDVRHGVGRIDYLGAHDHAWLNVLIGEFTRFEGRRWRELEQRLREPLGPPAPPLKLAAAAKALKRCFRSEKRHGFDAVRARHTVFELAAAAQLGRRETMHEAARQLGVGPAELEEILFSDVPGERRVVVPPSAPKAFDLSLAVNTALAQDLLRGASEVEVSAHESVRAIVRHARLRGLICSVRPDDEPSQSRIDVSGPFSLFRHTRVYGRALGELVPLVARSPRFLITALCRIRGELIPFQIGSGDPLLPAAEPRRYDSKLEERFARDFGRLALDWEALREPEAVPARGTLIFPDFLLRHRLEPSRRWLVEILGFWTRDYVTHKLDRLRDAGIPNLILCIDEERRCSESDLPRHARVIRFRKRVDVAGVLEIIEA